MNRAPLRWGLPGIATLTTSQMEAQHNKFGQVASNALTPTYTTRYSALLTMVTNPPRTQTFWLWSTNSRPSLSIAATPRKVPSTLLLSPTRLSTAHRQTLCRSSQRPINSGPPFTSLADVFSAGTEQCRSPIFDDPINLGPAASLHLNPALLDPPHLDQSNVLQIHTSLESLSWGGPLPFWLKPLWFKSE